MMSPYELKSQTGDSDSDAPPLSPPGMENIVTTIEFDESNPLTIKLEQDMAQPSCTMRDVIYNHRRSATAAAALVRDNRISRPKVDMGEKVIVTHSGHVNVEVASQNDDQKNVTTGIALKLVSQLIQSNLLKLAVDRNLPATFWTFGGPAPRVTGIRTQDGWAAVSIN